MTRANGLDGVVAGNSGDGQAGRTLHKWVLLTLLLAGAAAFGGGITWGLPSSNVQGFLFGERHRWSGAELLDLAGGWSDDPARGADVDRDALGPQPGPIVLNETDAQRAEIVRRFLLYSYQPDEMITMRALASMRPGEGKIDPRLYQYGGLWIYPVGGLIKAAEWLGWVNLRSDVAWYLDHPEDFARFYVLARTYSAAWGLVGVWAVFWLARRMSGGALLPAAFAGLGFVAMPVVINMAHEAKPHLAGAVLQLLAVVAATKYVEGQRRRWWLAIAVCCGAAFGMVLSAWPIFIVLPMAERLRWRRERGHSRSPAGFGPTVEPAGGPIESLPVGREAERLARRQRSIRPACYRVLGGGLLGAAVYLLTNPYIAVNLVVNRAVLESNFGNSLAMYEIGRWREGMANAARLISEGASPGLAWVGALAATGALAVGMMDRLRGENPPLRPVGAAQPQMSFPPARSTEPASNAAWLLAAPAVAILFQFIALAAGKPGEYGRFAVLPDVALGLAAAVGAWWILRVPTLRMLGLSLLMAGTCLEGYGYLRGFIRDSNPTPHRLLLARRLSAMLGDSSKTIAVEAEPAPYVLPPLDVFRWRILLCPKGQALHNAAADAVILAVDDPSLAPSPPEGFERVHTPRSRGPACTISWADKPILLYARKPPRS